MCYRCESPDEKAFFGVGKSVYIEKITTIYRSTKAEERFSLFVCCVRACVRYDQAWHDRKMANNGPPSSVTELGTEKTGHKKLNSKAVRMF